MKKTVSATYYPGGGAEGIKASCEFEYGDDLNHAVSLYGEDVVYKFYTQTLDRVLQADLRSCVEKGLSDEQIAEHFATKKLGVISRANKEQKAAKELTSSIEWLLENNPERLAQILAEKGVSI